MSGATDAFNSHLKSFSIQIPPDYSRRPNKWIYKRRETENQATVFFGPVPYSDYHLLLALPSLPAYFLAAILAAAASRAFFAACSSSCLQPRQRDPLEKFEPCFAHRYKWPCRKQRGLGTALQRQQWWIGPSFAAWVGTFFLALAAPVFLTIFDGDPFGDTTPFSIPPLLEDWGESGGVDSFFFFFLNTTFLGIFAAGVAMFDVSGVIGNFVGNNSLGFSEMRTIQMKESETYAHECSLSCFFSLFISLRMWNAIMALKTTRKRNRLA